MAAALVIYATSPAGSAQQILKKMPPSTTKDVRLLKAIHMMAKNFLNS
jgi:hypothetical protein